MVPVHRPRVDHHLMPTRRLADQLTAPLANIATKHLVAIFRNPDDVVLAVPDSMTATLVRFHNTSLHGNRSNAPCRLKAWVLLIPYGGL